VDLTGNFLRCQAAAIGALGTKAEYWLRTRGSYLASNPLNVASDMKIVYDQFKKASNASSPVLNASQSMSDMAAESSTVDSRDSSYNIKRTNHTYNDSRSADTSPDMAISMKSLGSNDGSTDIDIEKGSENRSNNDTEKRSEGRFDNNSEERSENRNSSCDPQGELKYPEGDPDTDMRQCLYIAQSCLREVFGPTLLEGATVELGTVRGDQIWG
jgi:hypothetical protein